MSCEQISPQGLKKNLKYKNVAEQMRVVRGYAIISKGETPVQISENEYRIHSQSSDATYTVQKLEDSFICNCPDFTKRQLECKHVHALRFYLALREKVKKDNVFRLYEKAAEHPKCIYCFSVDVVNNGTRKCKNRIKQRYLCNGCKRTFVEEKDFERFKGDSKVTALILDLFFKGISTRKICDHLEQFYNLRIDHSNILRRIHKFAKIINNYVSMLKPELGDIWHADEMKIQAGGKWKWLWHVMDENTKFLITKMLSHEREIRDAKTVFKHSKEASTNEPVFLITDGLQSYRESIHKTLPNTQHIRLRSLKDHPNNNIIERLNGTTRERLKVMRGLKGMKTADVLLDGFRDYYNFIRNHQSIGKTPAEAAGINLNLKGNKWLTLLEQSLSTEPHQKKQST